jgi:hypothetical protein
MTTRSGPLVLTSMFALAVLWLVSCGGGGGGSLPGPTPPPLPSPSPAPYQPLAVGDTWTYACYRGTPAPGASAFPKTNQVLGTVRVAGTVTYEYAEQIPSSPTQSTTQIQLLANDGNDNTMLYGYMANPTAAPQLVTPTIVVPSSPGPSNAPWDYPAQGGGTVQRVFCCSGVTNPTKFGVITVNEFYDGSHVVDMTTDGYGYARGQGVMEEDHNFNNPATRIDCIVTATPAP